MGSIYMSESCDIISTLGTPNFFFSVLLLATMMRTSACIFVRLKGDAIWNKFVLEKTKKLFFSELTGKTSTPLVLRILFRIWRS